MSDSTGDGSDTSDGPDDGSSSSQHSTMYLAGVVGALGFEFVGFIVGGCFVGIWIDKHLDTSPWGVIGMVVLGLVGVFWHVYRVTKRLLS